MILAKLAVEAGIATLDASGTSGHEVDRE